jgi:anti-sigma28 factor (negative regulator of flagellin synthesis)
MLKGVTIMMTDAHLSASQVRAKRGTTASENSLGQLGGSDTAAQTEDIVALRTAVGDTRTARINELRSAYQGGTYEVDAKQISKSLVDRHILP